MLLYTSPHYPLFIPMPIYDFDGVMEPDDERIKKLRAANDLKSFFKEWCNALDSLPSHEILLVKPSGKWLAKLMAEEKIKSFFQAKNGALYLNKMLYILIKFGASLKIKGHEKKDIDAALKHQMAFLSALNFLMLEDKFYSSLLIDSSLAEESKIEPPSIKKLIENPHTKALKHVKTVIQSLEASYRYQYNPQLFDAISARYSRFLREGSSLYNELAKRRYPGSYCHEKWGSYKEEASILARERNLEFGEFFYWLDNPWLLPNTSATEINYSSLNPVISFLSVYLISDIADLVFKYLFTFDDLPLYTLFTQQELKKENHAQLQWEECEQLSGSVAELQMPAFKSTCYIFKQNSDGTISNNPFDANVFTIDNETACTWSRENKDPQENTKIAALKPFVEKLPDKKKKLLGFILRSVTSFGINSFWNLALHGWHSYQIVSSSRYKKYDALEQGMEVFITPELSILIRPSMLIIKLLQHSTNFYSFLINLLRRISHNMLKPGFDIGEELIGRSYRWRTERTFYDKNSAVYEETDYLFIQAYTIKAFKLSMEIIINIPGLSETNTAFLNHLASDAQNQMLLSYLEKQFFKYVYKDSLVTYIDNSQSDTWGFGGKKNQKLALDVLEIVSRFLKNLRELKPVKKYLKTCRSTRIIDIHDKNKSKEFHKSFNSTLQACLELLKSEISNKVITEFSKKSELLDPKEGFFEALKDIFGDEFVTGLLEKIKSLKYLTSSSPFWQLASSSSSSSTQSSSTTAEKKHEHAPNPNRQ